MTGNVIHFFPSAANKSMAAPPLVFHFIGVVFTAVLYGKDCLITLGSERQVNA